MRAAKHAQVLLIHSVLRAVTVTISSLPAPPVYPPVPPSITKQTIISVFPATPTVLNAPALSTQNAPPASLLTCMLSPPPTAMWYALLGDTKTITPGPVLVSTAHIDCN